MNVCLIPVYMGLVKIRISIIAVLVMLDTPDSTVIQVCSIFISECQVLNDFIHPLASNTKLFASPVCHHPCLVITSVKEILNSWPFVCLLSIR